MKLVRGKIPELYPENTYRRVRDWEEHVLLLRLKLAEEVGELLSAPDRESLIKEIVDVRQVLMTLAGLSGISVPELVDTGLDKISQRGDFLDGWVLL